MTEIVMTPENRPYFDALMRILALGRNTDAEDKIIEAIQELMERRAEIAAMRPVVAFVTSVVQYPGITKYPHDLLAQAEAALAPMRAYVAEHPASDVPNAD